LNGKPFLSHLLDMSLALKFRKIFLLSSYHERELQAFLKENYTTANQIFPIYGGKMGRKWGVPWLLYSIRQKLKNPFIYSDGNIFYGKSVLKKIREVGVQKPLVANIVVSSKDLAPTHSRIITRGGRIQKIITRLPNSKNRNIGFNGRQYYSLGLMALSQNVFSSVSDFAYKKDLDFVIHDVFEFNKNLIKATIYNGSWSAIHTISDVDKLGIKG